MRSLTIRLITRRFAPMALGLVLALGGLVPSAHGQTKEPTDGFFDVPARSDADKGPDYGVPYYLVTSALGGFAVFILCKSARRS